MVVMMIQIILIKTTRNVGNNLYKKDIMSVNDTCSAWCFLYTQRAICNGHSG